MRPKQRRNNADRSRAASTKLLGFLHFRILLYEFYFHPAHCRDELRKTDLNEKRPAAHSLPKECAAGLPAPDESTALERVSSIMSAVCEGLYRDKFICQRIFAENTPFLLLNTFFSHGQFCCGSALPPTRQND